MLINYIQLLSRLRQLSNHVNVGRAPGFRFLSPYISSWKLTVRRSTRPSLTSLGAYPFSTNPHLTFLISFLRFPNAGPPPNESYPEGEWRQSQPNDRPPWTSGRNIGEDPRNLSGPPNQGWDGYPRERAPHPQWYNRGYSQQGWEDHGRNHRYRERERRDFRQVSVICHTSHFALATREAIQLR